MRLLLDTHVLLWWLADDPRLEVEARTAIADGGAQVAVSAASAWEIAIKQRLGKFRAPADLAAQLAQHRFVPLAVTVLHALRAGALPAVHDDPFDRMLVAQAELEGLIVVTRDADIGRYGVPILAW